MSARAQYRVLELGGALRGVKAEELEALLNGASAEGWILHQVIPRESSNRFLAIFRRSRERELPERRKEDESWIGDWGFS
jgi:hypothetical protein